MKNIYFSKIYFQLVIQLSENVLFCRYCPKYCKTMCDQHCSLAIEVSEKNSLLRIANCSSCVKRDIISNFFKVFFPRFLNILFFRCVQILIVYKTERDLSLLNASGWIQNYQCPQNSRHRCFKKVPLDRSFCYCKLQLFVRNFVFFNQALLILVVANIIRRIIADWKNIFRLFMLLMWFGNLRY